MIAISLPELWIPGKPLPVKVRRVRRPAARRPWWSLPKITEWAWLQQDPTTGALNQDPTTGAIWEGDATSNVCCCSACGRPASCGTAGTYWPSYLKLSLSSMDGPGTTNIFDFGTGTFVPGPPTLSNCYSGSVNSTTTYQMSMDGYFLKLFNVNFNGDYYLPLLVYQTAIIANGSNGSSVGNPFYAAIYGCAVPLSTFANPYYWWNGTTNCTGTVGTDTLDVRLIVQYVIGADPTMDKTNVTLSVNIVPSSEPLFNVTGGLIGGVYTATRGVIIINAGDSGDVSSTTPLTRSPTYANGVTTPTANYLCYNGNADITPCNLL